MADMINSGTLSGLLSGKSSISGSLSAKSLLSGSLSNPSTYDDTEIREELDNKANKTDIVQSDWEESDSSSNAYILNKPDLSQYAPLIVHCLEQVPGYSSIYIIDQTLADIEAAFDAGRRVICYNPNFDSASSIKYDAVPEVIPMIGYGTLLLQIGSTPMSIPGCKFFYSFYSTDINSLSNITIEIYDTSSYGVGYDQLAYCHIDSLQPWSS